MHEIRPEVSQEILENAAIWCHILGYNARNSVSVTRANTNTFPLNEIYLTNGVEWAVDFQLFRCWFAVNWNTFYEVWQWLDFAELRRYRVLDRPTDRASCLVFSWNVYKIDRWVGIHGHFEINIHDVSVGSGHGVVAVGGYTYSQPITSTLLLVLERWIAVIGWRCRAAIELQNGLYTRFVCAYYLLQPWWVYLCFMLLLISGGCNNWNPRNPTQFTKSSLFNMPIVSATY